MTPSLPKEAVPRKLTKEEALRLYNSDVWKSWTHEQLAKFQLNQELLCVPFGVFHEAVEKALGRPVWTHEFAQPEKLALELEGIRKQPTLEEIFSMIPKDKVIFVVKS